MPKGISHLQIYLILLLHYSQKEFISRQYVLLFTNIFAAVPYGSSNAAETQDPSDTSFFVTDCSLGRIATNVAPFSTIPSGNSKWGAYQSLILSAGTSVLFDADDADKGFTLNSSNWSLFIHRTPCPSASVNTKLSSVLCSAIIGWSK